MAYPDEKMAYDLHKQLWAARVPNPARRIKRHVDPVLARIDTCSFVLVSLAIELKAADFHVGWCWPCWLVRLGSVEEMVEGREKFVPAVLAWLSIVRLRDKAQGGDLLVQPEEIRRVVIP